MKHERPLWTKGILLSPQYFQQQTLLDAWQDERVARMGVMHPWGVLHAEFDAQALVQGRLKPARLEVRFPEGTQVDTDDMDVLPPTLALPADNHDVTVLLALPQLYPNGGNCLQPEEVAERPVRYRQVWRDVRNLFDDDMKPLAVMRHELTLRLSSQDNADYVTCPVARLLRDAQGHWLPDAAFIPPLLDVRASAWLTGQLELLMTQLRARIKRLMGMRRESNERMADFAVADVSLFWLLNALNSAEPVLGMFQRYPQVHPERLYQELARLAGALLTFSLEHESNAIPVYQHENLTATFIPLFSLLNTLLEASLPSRVIAIDLERDPRIYQWTARLHDPRLREGADFWLSVRSPLPAAQLYEQFPQLCKAGSPDDVSQVINVALNGIPLKAQTHVPAAIPLRLENQYFSLDLNNPAAQRMLASGACVFYVPGTLGDIELELFAVLRS
ncbi:type VI secretion system baseplate subunit TssK [Salmonella enterica subsp. enterica]|nr:type VI secretion system baseplate subunit TssK [Salmonella enterica subsp. enterica]